MKKNWPCEQQIGIISNSIADGAFTTNLEKEITSFNSAAERDQEMPAGLSCYDDGGGGVLSKHCEKPQFLQVILQQNGGFVFFAHNAPTLSSSSR